jgi:hypothetical protein
MSDGHRERSSKGGEPHPLSLEDSFRVDEDDNIFSDNVDTPASPSHVPPSPSPAPTSPSDVSGSDASREEDWEPSTSRTESPENHELTEARQRLLDNLQSQLNRMTYQQLQDLQESLHQRIHGLDMFDDGVRTEIGGDDEKLDGLRRRNSIKQDVTEWLEMNEGAQIKDILVRVDDMVDDLRGVPMQVEIAMKKWDAFREEIRRWTGEEGENQQEETQEREDVKEESDMDIDVDYENEEYDNEEYDNDEDDNDEDGNDEVKTEEYSN